MLFSDSGNVSSIFAPVWDTFLDENNRILGDAVDRLRRGEVNRFVFVTIFKQFILT